MFDSLPKLPSWVFGVFLFLAIFGGCCLIGLSAKYAFSHLHVIWK